MQKHEGEKEEVGSVQSEVSSHYETIQSVSTEEEGEKANANEVASNQSQLKTEVS